MDHQVKNDCKLCGRVDVKTTVHHLVPKEEGGVFGATINVCIPCHKQIHALYMIKKLRRVFPQLRI